MSGIRARALDRELKRGSPELLILSLLREHAAVRRVTEPEHA